MVEKNIEYKRKRTKVLLKLENGREIPATLSCRTDGECVVLPRPMVEVVFPKGVKKGEKKEVKK